MAVRGPYAKGVERRRQILDAALAVIARDGYSAASVAQLAEEVGLSQNGLLHYFGSKEALFVEVLRRRDELARDPIDPDGGFVEFRDAVTAVVRRNTEVGGLVELFARVIAESAQPGHSSHEFIRDRYAALRTEAGLGFAVLQARDEIRADLSADQLATMLFALIDGLQNQWLYDRTLDMVAPIETFFALLRTSHHPAPRSTP
jgi:AcrR family transcriptional regulator